MLWLCALALAARLATLGFPVPMEFDVGYYRAIATRLLAGDGYLFAEGVGFIYLGVLAAALVAMIVAWWRGRFREISPLLLWMVFGYAANIWFDVLVRFRYTSGTEMCLLLLAAWLIGTWSERKAVSHA